MYYEKIAPLIYTDIVISITTFWFIAKTIKNKGCIHINKISHGKATPSTVEVVVLVAAVDVIVILGISCESSVISEVVVLLVTCIATMSCLQDGVASVYA